MTKSRKRSPGAVDKNGQLPDTRAILAWFRTNRRDFPWRRNLRFRYRYRQIVSEVLLRRTRAATVASIYHEFFCQRFPTWKALAAATQSDLENLLFALGMWRERARTLPLLAQAVVDMNYRFPEERSELENLPGVGLYVASAILLFRHGNAEPLLDRNMARVLCRFHGLTQPVDLRRESELFNLATRLVSSVDTPLELNWALLDLGAMVCKPRPAKPACNNCPLIQHCRFAKTNRSFPRVL